MAVQKPRLLENPRVSPIVDTTRLMQLAPTLEIDVDTIIGEGIVGFGIKGSGKTNAGVLFAEQFGKFHIPMAVFDLEGDWLSLAKVLPRGFVATVENFPTGADILERGLQVVYDLSTWPNDELAASAMVAVVSQLMRTTSGQPAQERVPCLVFLDEAAYWLPQGKTDAFGEVTQRALLDTFHQLAARGRKRGLIPCLFTQRISEINKKVISQAGVRVLMRATQDNDLDRYLSYIQRGDLSPQQVKSRIQGFKTGQAIITLPGGAQKSVRFHQRQSEHVSHTPKVQAALNKYASMLLPARLKFSACPISEDGSAVSSEALPPQQPQQKPQTAADRVRAILKEQPDLRVSQLAKLAQCDQSIASKTRKAYFNLIFEKQPRKPRQKASERKLPTNSVVEQRIRAILSKSPDIKTGPLARTAHCSFSEAKKWRERIQGAPVK